MEFHGRKIIIEKAKAPRRTLVNKLSTNTVANDSQSMHKMPPTINGFRSRLPTTPSEEQRPFQNINSTLPNEIVPKKKNIALSSESILTGMKMIQVNSQVKEGRIHLKTFPDTKANQLNH